ncbi:MAG: hypothetical protein N2C14_05805, partial [Planctomycetales bacterium]
RKLRLSQLQTLRPSEQSRFQALRRVDQLIWDLASDRFRLRENAVEELRAFPHEIHGYLSRRMRDADDFEIKVRLQRVIREGYFSENGEDELSDRVTLSDGEEIRFGDLGDWRIPSRYRGMPLTLDRKLVEEIKPDSPKLVQAVLASNVGRVERIINDSDREFPPKQCTRIDFERSPDGVPLRPGANISRTFEPWGVKLATSLGGTFVSVNSYNVGGPSGGQSCASHSPLFRGELTIRFCMPGVARSSAGVTRVGCWIAAVRPNGTALQAFDAHRRLIGEIKTTTQQREFLSLRSTTPIAYARIVPDEKVDPDYTIDDLVFDTPRPLLDQGDERRYTVRLRSGERLYCDGLDLREGRLSLARLSVGIDRVEIPATEAAYLVSPTAQVSKKVPKTVCWGKLNDGSTVRLVPAEQFHCERFPSLEVAPGLLAALWGTDSSFLELGKEPAPQVGQAVAVAADKTERLGEATFGPTELSFLVDDATRSFPYRSAPTVWFSEPPSPPAGAARLRLVTGEELMLGENCRFQFLSWDENGATVRAGESEITLPSADVVSLVLSPTMPEGADNSDE